MDSMREQTVECATKRVVVVVVVVVAALTAHTPHLVIDVCHVAEPFMARDVP